MIYSECMLQLHIGQPGNGGKRREGIPNWKMDSKLAKMTTELSAAWIKENL